MGNAVEAELESSRRSRRPTHRPRVTEAVNPPTAPIVTFKLFGLFPTVAIFLSAGQSRMLAASQGFRAQKAPDFSVKATDGQTYSPDYLKGNAVLLYFWATWCPYCRKAVPHMNDLANEYANACFKIIGICGSKDTKTWHT